MNNLQETLFFPFQDAQARKQFLFASLVMLVGFIIPIIPMLILTGYTVKIMRQIIKERKAPSMPDWQESDWSEMLVDGLKVYGAQIVLMLPVMIIMGIGFLSMISGSIAASISISDNGQSLAPVGIPFFLLGFGVLMLFSIFTLPYSVIVSTVVPHVAATGSFSSAFKFKEWWKIFRKALGQFILAYVLSMAISWVLMFVIQFAMMTIILICIVPFLIIPYTAYNVLLKNALYAQAYVTGLDDLKEG